MDCVEEAVDNILNMFSRTKNNEELIQMVKRQNLSRQKAILVLQMNELCK